MNSPHRPESCDKPADALVSDLGEVRPAADIVRYDKVMISTRLRLCSVCDVFSLSLGC